MHLNLSWIVGAKEDADMKLLIAKQFVISFGSGVIVIVNIEDT